MKSAEYRDSIRRMVKVVLRKKLPGAKQKTLDEIAKELATVIHARFYGADVDGVISPLNRKFYDDGHPNKTVLELLEGEADEPQTAQASNL